MAVSPVGTAFIGRATERSLIERALEGAQKGRGGMLFIAGPTGSGVSRLLEYAVDHAAQAGFRVLHGEAVEGEQQPYAAMQRGLEEEGPRRRKGRGPGPSGANVSLEAGDAALPLALVGAERPFPPQDRGRAVSSRIGLEKAWGGLPLGELLSEPGTPELKLEELPPLGASMRVLERLGEMAGGAPLLLALDDFHWADPGSLALLRPLAREARKRPLMVVVGFETTEAGSDDRSDGRSVEALSRSVQRESGALRLGLKGLSEKEVRELCEQILGAPLIGEKEAPLPPILERAGGNPFFVQEVLRTGLREGWIARRGSGFRVEEPPHDAPVPTFLRWWVHRRLSGLLPSDRVLLEAISVLGNEFDPRALAALLPEEASTLRRGLERLEKRHALVHQVRPSVWRVDPGFLPGVVRSEIPGELLRRYQRRAGEWHAAHDPEAVERIAHHYLEAAEPSLALPWLERAWQAASDRGDNETSVRLARHGSAMVKAAGLSDQSVAWTLHEAHGLFQLGEGRQAVARVEGALEEAPAGMPRVELLTELALLETHRGSPEKSMALLNRAESEPVPQGLRSAAQVLVRRYRIMLLTRYQRWSEVCEEVPRLLASGPLVDERTRVRMLNDWGAALASRGEFDRAREVLGESITRARRGGFAWLETNARTSLGMLATVLGDLKIARAIFEQQEEEWRKRGAVTNQAINAGNTAEILADMGEMDEAHRCLTRTLDLCSMAGLTHIETILTPLRARCELESGHLREAEELLRPLLSSARLAADSETHREAHATMAMVLLAQGRSTEAFAEAEKAGREITGAMGPFAARVYARSQAASGSPVKGEILLNQVVQETQRAGRRFEQAMALWDLGELLAGQDRVSEARARWDEALGLLRACGAVARAARLEQRRRQLPGSGS